jgi:hypothetical protein
MMNLIAMLLVALALGAADVASAGDAAFSLAAWTVPDDDVRETYALLPDDARDARTEAGRDWTGISGDTALVLGAQVTVAALVYLLPGDVTGASTAEKDELFDTWWRHVRNPAWDADPWWVNYVGHPYWGATYYTRARERGFGPVGSFVYSLALSTLFEFGVEAFAEPPAYQDLIVTPVVGALLGAFVFEPIRARIKAKFEPRWYDHSIMIATDPIGALQAALAWAFGLKPGFQLQFRPRLAPAHDRTGSPVAQQSPRLGVELTLRY